MAKQNDELSKTIKGLTGKNVGKEILNEYKGDIITAGIGLAIAGGVTVYDMIKNRKNKGKKMK